MTATEARRLLLLRAHELLDPPSTTWTAADQSWASTEALRQQGEHATPEAWLLRRAALAEARLIQRDPAIASVAGAERIPVWFTALPVGIALLIGLGSNLVGPSQKINLLAPPLLAVMAWNLAVYLLMALHAAASARPQNAGTRQASQSGWLVKAMNRLSWRPTVQSQSNSAPSPALRRFVLDWASASQPLQTARIAAVLHLSAAALAAGAVGGLYLRGLAFEFRAGWDSTFLSAEAVHGWLSLLLAPAAWISGQTLPDAAQLEALRFSSGPGENAARWIHLYAITTAALVLLPRAALAGVASWRTGRLAGQFPLPLDDPYFQRLLRQLAQTGRQTAFRVTVLPYSYQPDAARQAAMTAALTEPLGPGLQIDWLPSVPLGGEDELDRHWPPSTSRDAPPPDVVATLFALTATPERETHAAFLNAVDRRRDMLTPVPRAMVLIDESGFRRRLAGADLPLRLAQRRSAWQALVEAAGQQAHFIELDAAADAAPPR